MSPDFPFRVASWAGWLPGSDSLALGGNAVARGALPASLRRRVSVIGRKLLETAWAVSPEGGVAPRLVLSSRHGEYSRTFALLGELARSGEVSPAEFSLSVHHALVGLLSITSGNVAGHTAVAAGPDSFACALLEAVSCLAEGDQAVLLMHFDEALPDIYAPVGGEAEEPIALAVLLLPDSAGEGDLLRFRVETATAAPAGPLAVRFADLLAGTVDAVSGGGSRMNWSWRRAA
jgi:hypothetical protein